MVDLISFLENPQTTVVQLREYAAEKEIDLQGATRKADIISVIKAAALPENNAVSASSDGAGEILTPEAEYTDTGAQGVTEGEEKDPPENKEETPDENAAENVTKTITKEDEPPPDNEPDSPPALFTLNRVLLVMKPLMQGADVKAVQTALIAHGYHVGARGADGIYTADTAKAVRHFQAANGFIVNGKVASQTAAALGAEWSGR